MSDRYIIGYGDHVGSIDPLVGFIVQDDGVTLRIINTMSTTFGNEVSKDVSLRKFLLNNRSFYLYDSELMEPVDIYSIAERI